MIEIGGLLAKVGQEQIAPLGAEPAAKQNQPRECRGRYLAGKSQIDHDGLAVVAHGGGASYPAGIIMVEPLAARRDLNVCGRG